MPEVEYAPGLIVFFTNDELVRLDEIKTRYPKSRKPRKKKTISNLEGLIALRNAGLSYVSIGKIYNLNPGTIWRHLNVGNNN